MLMINKTKQTQKVDDDDDMGEMWKAHREDQKARRAQRLPVRTKEIENLEKLGYKIQQFSDFQFRVNGVLDLYPTSNRFHFLPNNKRGGYSNTQEVCKKWCSRIPANNPKAELTKHRKRHEVLHKNLDELIADFLTNTKKLPSQSTVMELLQWSFEQTKNPTECTKN